MSEYYEYSVVVNGFPYKPAGCPGRVWRNPSMVGCSLCGTQVVLAHNFKPYQIECVSVRNSRFIEETDAYRDSSARPYFNDPYAAS